MCQTMEANKFCNSQAPWIKLHGTKLYLIQLNNSYNEVVKSYIHCELHKNGPRRRAFPLTGNIKKPKF